MRQRTEERLRVLEARVASLESTAPDHFEMVDLHTRVELSREKLTRTYRRIGQGVLAIVVASTAFAVLAVALTRGG